MDSQSEWGLEVDRGKVDGSYWQDQQKSMQLKCGGCSCGGS